MTYKKIIKMSFIKNPTNLIQTELYTPPNHQQHHPSHITWHAYHTQEVTFGEHAQKGAEARTRGLSSRPAGTHRQGASLNVIHFD